MSAGIDGLPREALKPPVWEYNASVFWIGRTPYITGGRLTSSTDIEDFRDNGNGVPKLRCSCGGVLNCRDDKHSKDGCSCGPRTIKRVSIADEPRMKWNPLAVSKATLKTGITDLAVRIAEENGWPTPGEVYDEVSKAKKRAMKKYGIHPGQIPSDPDTIAFQNGSTIRYYKNLKDGLRSPHPDTAFWLWDSEENGWHWVSRKRFFENAAKYPEEE